MTLTRLACFFAAGALLLTSCGDDTAGTDAELQSILEGLSQRGGMSDRNCEERCVADSLRIFDQCVRRTGDRKGCFGRAIHHFYRCAEECDPPTCEERCEERATRVFAACIEAGGSRAQCRDRAERALRECLEECDPPEPPTCEERCERRAREVFTVCIERGGNEARCAQRAEEFLQECLDECTPEEECRSDLDCDDGEVCELGGQGCDTPVCVPGCHEDDQCADDEECREVFCVTCPCPGICQDLPEPGCSSDLDCGDGEVCEPTGRGCDTPMCVPGCHEDDQCGESQECLRVDCFTCPCPGICQDVPEPDCSSDLDCGAGEVCELGGRACDTPVCVPGCHEDDQCGESQECLRVDCFTCPCPGICQDVPEPDCSSDLDCGAGEVCELGGRACDTPVCVTGCHEDEQCGDGAECRQVECVTCPCPGICEVVDEPDCQSDDDCPDDQVCELGGQGCDTPVCVTGCHEDSQCGDGAACARVECITCPCPGQCEVVDEPDCQSDSDCGDGQVCEPGGPGCDTPVCVTGCHEDAQCGSGGQCQQVFCVTCPCPGQCAL